MFPEEAKRGRWCLLVSPDATDGSLHIRQDAKLSAALLDGAETLDYPIAAGRRIYLHVARGSLRANGHELRAGDALMVGKLFNESHASLRDDFEVTNEALNQMVNCAQAHSACYGARMTGAGFGGCAVALVKREQVEAFVEATERAYQAVSGLDAVIYVCSAAQGASLVYLE